MKQRTYTGEANLKRLQEFNALAIAETDHCGYLHPGDIPHHIYNGNKLYPPEELLTIWEDACGISAWLLVNPRFKGFDAQVRPDLRGSDLERELLKLAEERTRECMGRFEIDGERIYADVYVGEPARAELLSKLGWEPEEALPYVLNRMKIQSVPEPNLPDGFVIRAATDTAEAAALAQIHSAAFGSKWTPELYRNVIESPGYDPARELVIQGPDGSFTAFAVIWFDHLNRTGLFEPVGTHKDHRRRGFGRAILQYGLQKMAAAGMEYATVAHFGDNDAARRLYRACGFKPWHVIHSYTKSV